MIREKKAEYMRKYRKFQTWRKKEVQIAINNHDLKRAEKLMNMKPNISFAPYSLKGARKWTRDLEGTRGQAAYNKARELNYAGYTVNEISRILNLSRNTVERYLRNKPGRPSQ